MSKIQSILFKNKSYNTTNARQWLGKHQFDPIKPVHKTKNYLRYRLRKPNKNYRYFIKTITPSIKFVLMFEK